MFRVRVPSPDIKPLPLLVKLDCIKAIVFHLLCQVFSGLCFRGRLEKLRVQLSYQVEQPPHVFTLAPDHLRLAALVVF